jgi:hypothetical protein
MLRVCGLVSGQAAAAPVQLEGLGSIVKVTTSPAGRLLNQTLTMKLRVPEPPAGREGTEDTPLAINKKLFGSAEISAALLLKATELSL